MAYPKCPYCDYQFDSEDIYYSGSTCFPTESDGDETDTKCLNCNQPLKIVLSLEPSWAFVNEDHEEITPQRG